MEWKTINIDGLGIYQISEEGSVRTTINKRILSQGELDGEKCIMLTIYDEREMFFIKDLLRYTFKPEEPEGWQLPKKKPEEFSDNEWDYGKDIHEDCWKDLKGQYRILKWLKGEKSPGNLE